MATYHVDYLTRDELKDAFDGARRDGKSHLIVLRHTLAEVLSIHDDFYTRSVDSLDEIVGILRDANPHPFYGTSTELDRIYDVNQDFDLQLSFTNAAGAVSPASYYMPSQTAEDLRADLEAFYEQRNYEWALHSWNHQPWFKKIFSKPPERPASMVDTLPEPAI